MFEIININIYRPQINRDGFFAALKCVHNNALCFLGAISAAPPPAGTPSPNSFSYSRPAIILYWSGHLVKGGVSRPPYSSAGWQHS